MDKIKIIMGKEVISNLYMPILIIIIIILITIVLTKKELRRSEK